MTCDLCSQKEATVHLAEVINGKTRELHLCEPCARKKGAEAAEQLALKAGPEELFGGGLAGLLAGLADLGVKSPEGKAIQKLSCSRCGMTVEDFKKSGRLGCAGCYESFQKTLAPLLRRIHGSSQYFGRVPPAPVPGTKKKAAEPKEDLAALKEKLKEAVASEAFEEAARLRDRVRALEGKKKRA